MRDAPDREKILRAVLQSHHFSTVVCYVAPKIKEKLSQEKFAAMILDINVLGKDEIALVKELRETVLAVPLPTVVLSERKILKELQLDSKNFPIIEWFNNPIDLSKLMDVLENIKQHLHDRKKILHIEDDKDFCQIVVAQLQDIADVEFAYTMQEAKAKIKKEHYDLIILDIALPDEQGLTVLKSLTGANADVPVIIFAAGDFQTSDKHVRSKLVKSKTSNEDLRKKIKEAMDTDSDD